MRLGRRHLQSRAFGVAAMALGLALLPIAGEPGSFQLALDSSLGQQKETTYGFSEVPDPVQFTPAELGELERRYGVHGSQTRLAQLFTSGIDQLQPLRTITLGRISELQPLIRAESERQKVNPLLVAAVLFDEMRHAKPGEDLPIAAHSGLFSTHGPAQLGLGELVHQGLLKPNATEQEISKARDQLLDRDKNVKLLIGKFARLSGELNFPRHRMLQASSSPRDAKALATLAYLHNGKLDYPRRILRAMQDPELHAVIYGVKQSPVSHLI
ncbi:helicase DnaB [Cyanobium sp. WAJ14-Wanaka]|nr:helicase DnaB [Cyanobium sp. WAJ14-Wanaka]